MPTSPVTRAREYFERYRGTQGSLPAATGKIPFAGVEGRDVYNITAPFVSAGRTVMAGAGTRVSWSSGTSGRVTFSSG